ncbi:MAG TPA: ABC transporter permease subunit, partial [Ilumatobacteraceae bacterium]
MRSTDGSSLRRRLRRAALFVLSLALVAVAWELYKLIGPADGGSILGWKLLPRANDNAMPHVSDMLSRYSRPEVRGSDRRIWSVVLAAIWFSLRLAFVGFLIGALFGLLLAVVMTRFKVVERGLFPYLVVSQTVPLIALAPLVATWGGKVQIGEFVWPRWMSVAVIGAFLAFFPIAVGALKGLSSAPQASLELMDSYAASWRQTLFKLRFPAAVPYLVPAMRLAASAAVVGVVVAEISTGLKGGLGRLILEYAREATSDPAKVYTALFGAAALGLAMAALVAAL